jgi:uncharacterized protein with PIN domain
MITYMTVHPPFLAEAQFAFHGELNDFLSRERRQGAFVHSFSPGATVKDVIEAIGVPHPEVGTIRAGGGVVALSYPVRPGDRIDVAPRPPTLPPAGARFVLDTHLGRLARYLRLLGFDTIYRNDWLDEELAELGSSDGRLLLTRDVGLLKRAQVEYGYWLRATDPRRQAVEVVGRYALAGAIAPFRRCLRCNGELVDVAKEDVESELPPRTRRFYDDFRRCPGCRGLYWPGSHHARLVELVDFVRAAAGGRG